MFAYAAEERRREIGLRMALGATRSQIVRVMVSTSGPAMVIGLAVGVLASFASGSVLNEYLYGLNPLDPMAYGLVAALLVLAGTLHAHPRAARVSG